ncbi:MAG: hypothetical protein IJ736_11890, partial [Firmicutes bacterium]|nr:hypothetical protein [Bacillota bacterium]
KTYVYLKRGCEKILFFHTLFAVLSACIVQQFYCVKPQLPLCRPVLGGAHLQACKVCGLKSTPHTGKACAAEYDNVKMNN